MIFLRPSQQWHYATNDQRHGPIGSDELRRLALEGRLGKEDLVWSKGMQDWVPASTVDGLFSKGPSTPAATQPTNAALKPRATASNGIRTSKIPLLAGIGLAACGVFGVAGYWAWWKHHAEPNPVSAASTEGASAPSPSAEARHDLPAVPSVSSRTNSADAAQAADLPSFNQNEGYASIRAKMLGAGWQPFRSKDAVGCIEGDPRCKGRPEAETCSSTGLGYCAFGWQKDGKAVDIVTSGQNPEGDTVFNHVSLQPNDQSAIRHSVESAPAAIADQRAARPQQPPQPATVQQSGIPPSFDCRKASTATEHAICGSPELSSLDGQLGATYSDLIAATPTDQLKATRTDQASWIKNRDTTCNGDTTCLGSYLRQRIATLKQGTINRPAFGQTSSRPTSTQKGTEFGAVDVPASVNKAYPPRYPPQAVREHHEGKVSLKVLVGRDGKATDLAIESSSGYDELDRAAIATVQAWTFNPARKDGNPVESHVRVPVDFSLKN